MRPFALALLFVAAVGCGGKPAPPSPAEAYATAEKQARLEREIHEIQMENGEKVLEFGRQLHARQDYRPEQFDRLQAIIAVIVAERDRRTGTVDRKTIEGLEKEHAATKWSAEQFDYATVEEFFAAHPAPASP